MSYQQGPPVQTTSPDPSVNYTQVYAQNFRLGHNPATLQCPHCAATVTTGTHPSDQCCGGNLVLLSSLLLGLFAWAFCLCFIPCCISDCKDTVHVCPNCQNVIGVQGRI
eukprot:TRINITY_DN11234_c0_g1_i1.p1 TRINITY_DN11234_c0_g1~~TRINITY_DN11234_c0_g1_i1.p1  ORF type:complete len:109 (+),score=13.30 TRINITY_DN11234_c0_g1_i1:45-371(+)